MTGKNLVFEWNAKMLHIDDVILHEWGQACPGMPKEAFKTLIFQKLMKVYLLKLQIDYVILDGQACPGMPKEAFETYISKTIQRQKSISTPGVNHVMLI